MPSGQQQQLQHNAGQAFQGLPIGSGCLIRPDMPVDAHDKQTWKNELEKRVIYEVQENSKFRSMEGYFSFCQVTDMMGSTKPCILYICWHKNWGHDVDDKTISRARKKLQKRVDKFRSLQGCKFSCKVVIDQAIFATSFGQHSEAVKTFKAAEDGSRQTWVGASLHTSDQPNQVLKLGGLIRTDLGVFALTAGHSFVEHLRTRSAFANKRRGESDDLLNPPDQRNDSDDMSSSGSDCSSTTSGEDMVLVSTSSRLIGYDPAHIDTSSHEDLTPVGGHSEISFGSFYGSSFDESTHSHEVDRQLDWGLIKIDNVVPVLANSYTIPENGTSVAVTEVLDRSPESGDTVFILNGGTPMGGIIGQSDIDIRIQGISLLVTEVIFSAMPGEFASRLILQR